MTWTHGLCVRYFKISVLGSVAANEIIGSNLKNHSQTPVVEYPADPREAGKNIWKMKESMH